MKTRRLKRQKRERERERERHKKMIDGVRAVLFQREPPK